MASGSSLLVPFLPIMADIWYNHFSHYKLSPVNKTYITESLTCKTSQDRSVVHRYTDNTSRGKDSHKEIVDYQDKPIMFITTVIVDISTVILKTVHKE